MTPDDYGDLARQGTTAGWAIGRRLRGRYRLERRVGAGGMGVVWRARDEERGGRLIAIKTLPDALRDDPQGLKQLRREADLAIELRHPAIVGVNHLETESDGIFMVMEYVEGSSLAQRLAKRERLSPDEVRRLAGCLCAALAYAHARGVIHRDIKPANILLAPDGAKLADFGIATVVRETLSRLSGPRDDPRMGTLPYMAPEQVSGRGATPSTDLYQLAATLYECLAGHPPFYQGAIEHQILNVPVPPLTDVPAALASVIVRALEKDPAARPASADEFARLLAVPAVVPLPTPEATEPPRSEPEDLSREAPSTAERDDFSSRAPRRRGWRGAGIAVLLIVAAGTYELARTRLGTLVISPGQDAGVQVWLDDRLIGETEKGAPLTIAHVAPGTRRLLGRKLGYEDWRRDVQIAAGQRTEVALDLVPLKTAKAAESQERSEPTPAAPPPSGPETSVKSETGLPRETGSAKMSDLTEQAPPSIAQPPDTTSSRVPGESLRRRVDSQAPPAPDNGRGEVTSDSGARLATRSMKGQDGADMVLVPAGEFLMGSPPAEIERAKQSCVEQKNKDDECWQWFVRESPQYSVTLAAFYMDRFEVTNALFERFVGATGHTTTAEAQGFGWHWQHASGKPQHVQVQKATWRTPTGPGSEARTHHPVVQVSWHDAVAYCRWAGKRLPTEAEWEKAARGTDGRRYPWGNDWQNSHTNGAVSVGTTRPAGSYPNGASPYAVHDMAGNVWEWVADWFNWATYNWKVKQNPRGPETGSNRVLRGGSWLNGPLFLRATARGDMASDYRGSTVGFRCASDGPP